jgi:putative serine protease PepD
MSETPADRSSSDPGPETRPDRPIDEPSAGERTFAFSASDAPAEPTTELAPASAPASSSASSSSGSSASSSSNGPVTYRATAWNAAPSIPAAAASQGLAWPKAGPGSGFSAAGGTPNWTSPAPTGLPSFNGRGNGNGNGAEPPPAETSRSGGLRRVVLVAAIIAGLIGGGVGAGITYLATRNDNSTTGSSSATGTDTNGTGSSNGLNTASPNATAVTGVAAKVLPSVVLIVVSNSDGSTEQGTGIVVSSTGQILTNNHVIQDAATSGAPISVTFDTGRIAPASVVGRDPTSDLAVIKAGGVTGLTPATLGTSSSVVVGQQVVAIGNPLGLSDTVTSGIVSALNRPVTTQAASDATGTPDSTVLDAIQTDAAINPGNSGGPLVDLSGQVIGINTAIATAPSTGGLGGSSASGNIGIGFAIPIDQASWIMQELISNGTATHSMLGVNVSDPAGNATQTGAVVQTVTANTPASRAGFKVGDVITTVDGQQISGADSLVAAIRSYKPGTQVSITYMRGTQTKTAKVTLSTQSG